MDIEMPADEFFEKMAEWYVFQAWPGMPWKSWSESDRNLMVERFKEAYRIALIRTDKGQLDTESQPV